MENAAKPLSPLTDTAETVLARRYYLRDNEGRITENWESLCRRVANAVAAVDAGLPDAEDLAERFFTMLHSLDFLPNSPCLMNAGTDLGQLSACFVLPVEDSMEGIFTAVKNGALVHKTGGGTGYSFSRLRPKNAATETIKQGGKRRGANMGVLREVIRDFIELLNIIHQHPATDVPALLRSGDFAPPPESGGDLAEFEL